MIVYGTSKTKKIPGPALRMNCSACGLDDAPARSYESEERIRLYFIPLPTQRERHVVCLACGADRLSSLPLDELAGLGSEQIEWYLNARVSMVNGFLAIASVVLFCTPVIGLVLGICAMVACRKSRGWPYRVGLIGVVLTTFLWGGLLLRSALIELGVV